MIDDGGESVIRVGLSEVKGDGFGNLELAFDFIVPVGDGVGDSGNHPLAQVVDRDMDCWAQFLGDAPGEGSFARAGWTGDEKDGQYFLVAPTWGINSEKVLDKKVATFVFAKFSTGSVIGTREVDEINIFLRFLQGIEEAECRFGGDI
jgi:hypothetical protein